MPRLTRSLRWLLAGWLAAVTLGAAVVWYGLSAMVDPATAEPPLYTPDRPGSAQFDRAVRRPVHCQGGRAVAVYEDDGVHFTRISAEPGYHWSVRYADPGGTELRFTRGGETCVAHAYQEDGRTVLDIAEQSD